VKDEKQNFIKKLFGIILPPLLILLATSVFFWKVFLYGQVPIPGDFMVGTYYPWLDYKWGFEVGVPVKNAITSDVVSIIYPMQTLAINMWKSGQIPLWNPYIFCGTPLLANFQSAIFSPTNVVYFFLDRVDGWTTQIILQHILAALFTFLLLRRWRVSRLGAFLGALVFAFSGFNVIWSEWNGHTLAAAFIPLGILLADKFLSDGSLGGGIFIPVVLAFLFFSGYPQIALYFLIALFLLWIFYFKLNKVMIFRTFLMLLFFVIGIGLSAPQTLPGAELLRNSQRTAETISFDYEFLHWEKVITFVAPDFFGNHSTGNYWGSQNYTSNEGFVGVVALSFSFVAWHLFRKNRKIVYSILLLVVSLLLAFPTPVSVIIWKSGIFGLNAAFAHRSLVLFNLSVAILAGFGIDYFVIQKKISIKNLLLPGVLLVGFLAYSVALYFLSKNYPERFPPLILGIPAYVVGLRNLVIPIAIYMVIVVSFFIANNLDQRGKRIVAVFLLLITFAELCRFGWKYTPFSSKDLIFPETPVIKFLMERPKPVRISSTDLMSVDMRMPYRIESLEGYDATYPVTIARIIAAVNSGRSNTSLTGQHGLVENISSPVLRLLNTEYFLGLKTNKALNSLGIPKVFEDKSSIVFENKGALPRAFMVYDWETVDEGGSYLDLLLKKDFPYGTRILVEKYNTTPGNHGIYKVDYEKYLETESIIKVETSENGLLFVSDTFFPGWLAFVDGEKAPIYKADFAFRAIAVPRGVHEVKMVYRPKSFMMGLETFGISALSLTFLYIILLALGRRRR
jgi:hypothetical protein